MANLPADKLMIGRSLLAGGPITQQVLQRELDRSGKKDSVLGKALLQSGFPEEEDLIVPLLQRLRIPKINARNTKIPLETIRLIDPDVAKRNRVLAIDQIGNILVVVTPNLGKDEVLAEVRKETGFLVTPIQCAEEGFDKIVADYYARLAERPDLALPKKGGPSPTNGVRKAIPVGSGAEDVWWRRYWSGGPIPAQAAQM